MNLLLNYVTMVLIGSPIYIYASYAKAFPVLSMVLTFQTIWDLVDVLKGIMIDFCLID